jgi:hypothetical protein
MQDQIEKDLKAALLAGDKLKTETLRGLKNALQYEAVNSGFKNRELTDEQAQKVFAREAKKRQEAADLYKQGGNSERAEAEMAEKQIIESYLPQQLSEDEIAKAVDEELAKINSPVPSDMGKVIGAVRSRLGASADGATIARLVKERLNQ